MYQKMRKKYPHLLIPMSSQRLTGENGFEGKNSQKMEVTGVKIARVDVKSNEHPLFHI